MGFEQLKYTGNEGDSVEICVRLFFSGTVSDEFVVDVDLFADDDTASGECVQPATGQHECLLVD